MFSTLEDDLGNHLKTLFDIHVEVTYTGGVWYYECPRGLWGVSGEDADKARQEAYHYFVQYWEDGDYFLLTGGE